MTAPEPECVFVTGWRNRLYHAVKNDADAAQFARDMFAISGKIEIWLATGFDHARASARAASDDIMRSAANNSDDASFSGRRITTKYPGTCAVCRAPWAAGETVLWSRGRGAAHIRCGEEEA